MGNITLQAPDGTPQTFGIEGDSASPEEMRRFLSIMAKTNPAAEDPNANAPNPAPQAKDSFFENNRTSYFFNNENPYSGADSTPEPYPVATQPDAQPSTMSPEAMSNPSLADTKSGFSAPTEEVLGPEPQAKENTVAPVQPTVPTVDSPTALVSEPDSEVASQAPVNIPPAEPEPSVSVATATANAKDLPAPSSGMFDSLMDNITSPDQNYDIVVNTLNEYINHPRTEQRWDGRHIYTDAKGDQYRVPKIMWDKMSNTPYIMDSWAVEGVEDGFKSTVEFVADIGDFIRDKISDDGINDEESWGQFIRDNTSEYSEEGQGLRGLGGEASGVIGVGGPIVKGAKWLGGLFKSTKEVGKLRKAVGGLMGATGEAIAFTAPIDGESSGLFLGEDAFVKASDYMPILEGLDPNATDAEWKQRLENRRNMIIEGAAISKLFSSTIQGAISGVRALNAFTIGGLFGSFKKSAQEKAAMGDILQKLIRAEGANSPEQRKQFMEAFAASLDKYAVEINTINDSVLQGAETNRSTMNAFLMAVESGDYGQAGQIAYRLQNPNQVMNRAQGIQQGAINNPAMTNTAIKAEAAQETFSDAVKTADTNLGGMAAVNRSAKMVQDGSEDAATVGRTSSEIQELESALDTLDDRLTEEINTGGTISATLNRLSQLTGINLNRNADNAIDTVVTRVSAAYRNLKGQRVAQYGKVNGGALDDRGLFEFLKEMDPADLSEAATTLGYAPRLKKLLESVSSRNRTVSTDTVSGLDNFDPVPAGKQSVEMSDDEIFLEFQGALADADIVDYGSLFQNLRADLARTKSDLFDSGGNAQKSAGRSINDLIKYIDGELLDSTGDVELLENVSRAIDWDQANFIPYFKDQDTALGQVAKLYDEKIDPTSGGLTGVSRNTSFQDVARSTITDNLSRRTRSNATAIVTLLQRPEAGGTDELVDFVLFESLGPIMSRLRAGGAAPKQAEIMDALNNLAVYETVLRKSNPQLADELDQLGTSIYNGAYNKDDLLKALDRAQTNNTKTLERLRESEIQDFFTSQGIPVKVGMDAFDGLINNYVTGGRRNVGRLNTLTKQFMEEAENGRPLLLEGLQAAYMKRFGAALKTTSDGATKSGGLSQAQISKELGTETGKWIDGLKIVFADRPDAADLIINLYNKAAQEQGFRVARPDRGNSVTARTKAQQLEQLGNIITFVYGNLNRTGARLRRAGTAVINKKFNASAWDQMSDDILSNPQTAKRLTEIILKEEFNPSITSRVVASTIDALVYAGMFGPEDAEEARQMNFEIIAASAEAEANVRQYTRDGKTFMGNIWDQTKDAFSETFLQ
jgi:hypothetical protein